MRQVLRDPFVHFIALGTLLFTGSSLLSTPPRTVVLPPTIERQLASNFEEQHTLSPNPAQRRALLDNFIRDEVLILEAQRLQLGKGDPVIRRRLLQSMEFFLKDTTPVPIPDDTALEHWRKQNEKKYTRDTAINFTHRFFPHSTDQESKINAVKCHRKLTSNRSCHGAPFIHGMQFSEVSLQSLRNRFGQSFASHIEELSPGEEWSRPLRSIYGWHVVQLTKRTEATPIPFPQLRHRLEQDFIRAQQERLFQQKIQKLVNTYAVDRAPQNT